MVLRANFIFCKANTKEHFRSRGDVLNALETQIIHIIKKALFEDFECSLTEDLAWDEVFKLGALHNIIPILAEGILNLDIDDNIKNIFLAQHRRHAVVHFGQMERLQAIQDAFENAQIDHMLLKGKNLKDLYPKPEMRTMGDFDILIKPDQYDKIQKCLSGLGLFNTGESDHEIIWTDNSFAFLELHKRLFPSYNDDFSKYFGIGWERAKLQNGSKHTFSLSKEDEYIFIFTHFAKHYRDGGVGIKHMLDIYLFNFKNPDMDQNYIEAELKKLGLFEFHKNTIKTLSVWFENGKPCEVSDLITQKIFKSGSFGTAAEKQKASALRESNRHKTTLGAKVGAFLKAAFPPLKVIKDSYPVLSVLPILLPLMWILRILKGIIFKQNASKNVFSKIKNINKQTIESYQSDLSKVGLNDKF